MDRGTMRRTARDTLVESAFLAGSYLYRLVSLKHCVLRKLSQSLLQVAMGKRLFVNSPFLPGDQEKYPGCDRKRDQRA
jgi:hypothetical protein